jgi:transcriptional regulator with XRE-family HTH domain
VDNDRLRANRVLQGLSQFQLAQKARISVASMSQIERLAKPNPEIMKRIECALCLTEDREAENA